MDNTWSSMFWCLEGPHERGECPETGLLWVRDGHLGPGLTNHSPVLASCGPIRCQGRVWAPLVSRAADHHHQKPLIPLLAGKIVKTQLSQISKHIIGFFCCQPPNIIRVIGAGIGTHGTWPLNIVGTWLLTPAAPSQHASPVLPRGGGWGLN